MNQSTFLNLGLVNRFLAGLLFFIWMALTVSCSSGDILVGKWQAIEGKSHFAAKKITFEADGTFYFDQVQGNWEIAEDGQLIIQFPNVLPNRYEFTIKDGTLIMKDQVGIAGEFSRAH